MKKQYRDGRWAWYQIYRSNIPIGKPVWAVSGAQAIHIVLKSFGNDQSGKWHAERVSQTLKEMKERQISKRKLRNLIIHPAACPECGYFDPSRMASQCPNCDTPR